MAQLIRQEFIDLHIHKRGSIFVKASDLQYEEGNWENHVTHVELKASCTFKVSGDCHLPAGKDLYKGEFVIELGEHHTMGKVIELEKHHSMGKVKTQISPPEQESEVDLTDHVSGKKESIEMGVCHGKHAKFSLTSAEPKWKVQKGLIIYGVVFTPVLFK